MIGSWHRLVYALAPALLALSACSSSGSSGDASSDSNASGDFGGGGGKASGGAGAGSAGRGSGNGNGTGNGSGVGGHFTSGTTVSGSTGSGNCEHVLHAVVRDRSPDAPDQNPDFENANQGDDTNIVKVDLGSDHTPDYNGNPTTSTTNGAQFFHEWYHDLANTPNHDFDIDLPLTDAGGGLFTYDNEAYFPIDGQGYGDYGSSGHNFHFTTEVHTLFQYNGGEVFTFTGDDDLFAYIDKKLAINLGGIHSAETQSVDLDTLGLTVGQMYPLDIFGAERHTTESHFRVDTTIGCLTTPPPQ